MVLKNIILKDNNVEKLLKHCCAQSNDKQFAFTKVHFSPESEKDGEPRNQVPEEGCHEINNSLLNIFII